MRRGLAALRRLHTLRLEYPSPVAATLALLPAAAALTQLQLMATRRKDPAGCIPAALQELHVAMPQLHTAICIPDWHASKQRDTATEEECAQVERVTVLDAIPPLLIQPHECC